MKHAGMLFAAMAFTISLNAQWVRTQGPGGGYMSAMANDGSRVMAAARVGGVFFSSDAGGTWVEANNGLGDRIVSALTLTGTAAYAGSEDGGVYRTTNDGGDWAALNGALTDTIISAIVVDGPNLFVASNGNGAFRSTDGGGTWTPINNGLPNPTITSLVSLGGALYAGTFGDGVFTSIDGGDNWSPRNNGLLGLGVNTLAAMGSTLFAGSWGSDSGLYASTDAGSTWDQVPMGLTMEEHITFQVVASGTKVLACMVGPWMESIPFMMASDDGGANWSAAGAVVTNQVMCAAISGSTMLVGTHGGGVFASTDTGADWVPSSAGMALATVNTLLVAGSHLVADLSIGQVSRSGDHGDTWIAATAGLSLHQVAHFTQSEGTLFAYTFFFQGWGVDLKLWSSTDDGDTWSVLVEEPIGFNSLAAKGATLFGGAYENLHRSIDGGLSWSAINNGLPDVTGHHVKMLGASGQQLYAQVSEGDMYRSADGGDTWTLSMASGLPTHAMAFAGRGDTVLVGFYDEDANYDGIKLSADAGQNWSEVNDGLTDRHVHALLEVNGHFVAGTDSGVFVLNEALTEWAPINTGLQRLQVTVLSADDAYLYAGIGESGVWRRTLWEVALSVPEPMVASAPLVYPNPATDRLTVVCEGTPGTGTTIRIRSADGKLVHQAMIMGRSMVEVDTRLFPEGVYAVSIEQENATRTTKCIIVR